MENIHNIMEIWFDENSKTTEDEKLEKYVTIEDIKTYFDSIPFPRRQFKYPSYEELMKTAESQVGVGCQQLTKSVVGYFIRLWEIKPDAEHELLLALQVLDTENRGVLSGGFLAAALGSRYDAFDADEVREFLRDGDIHGHGDIFYSEFVRTLFAKAPQLRDEPIDFLYTADEDPTSLSRNDSVNNLNNEKHKGKAKRNI